MELFTLKHFKIYTEGQLLCLSSPCPFITYAFITIPSSPKILSVLFSPLLSTILQNLFHLPLKMNLHFHHILFQATAKPGFITALELLNVSCVSTWTHYVWSIIHGVSA